jgi:hypothetical protein
MIWGEFINQIRNLHLELLDQFSIQPITFTGDVELQSEGFPFPETGDDFGEWETPVLPEKILEALEFHPVERVLLEGPIMPIQEVLINPDQWESLYQAVMKLEKEWLTKTKLLSPDKLIFIEQNLRAKFLQLQRRSGRFGLKSL